MSHPPHPLTPSTQGSTLSPEPPPTLTRHSLSATNLLLKQGGSHNGRVCRNKGILRGGLNTAGCGGGHGHSTGLPQGCLAVTHPVPTPVTPHRTVAAGYAHGDEDGAHGHHGQHGAGDRDSQPCGVRQQGEGDGGVTPAAPQHHGAARTHPNPSSLPAPQGLRGGETVLDWAPVPWGAPWGPGTSWAEPRAAPGDRDGCWLPPGALQGEAHQAPLGTGSPRRTHRSH